MGKFKAVIILILGLGVLPSFADAVITGPYPWPWPWSVQCPIRWNDLEGSYTLPNLNEGAQLTITLSRVNGTTMQGVHVRRTDVSKSGAVHSDGFKWISKDKRFVMIRMVPQNGGHDPYWLQIGMYLNQKNQTDDCSSDKVSSVMTLIPANGEPTNYVLD